MSIASEITRINNNIAAAYTAASSKGATIPQTQNSANLANCIGSISGGSGIETRNLTIKLINTIGAEGEGWCYNGSTFPSYFTVNGTTITSNSCTYDGYTYSMYAPDAIYDLINVSCYTYQTTFTKDTSVTIQINCEGGYLTQVDKANGVTDITNNNFYLETITLSKDTVIKLFWGFDSNDIDIENDDEIIR